MWSSGKIGLTPMILYAFLHLLTTFKNQDCTKKSRFSAFLDTSEGLDCHPGPSFAHRRPVLGTHPVGHALCLASQFPPSMLHPFVFPAWLWKAFEFEATGVDEALGRQSQAFWPSGLRGARWAAAGGEPCAHGHSLHDPVVPPIGKPTEKRRTQSRGHALFISAEGSPCCPHYHR